MIVIIVDFNRTYRGIRTMQYATWLARQIDVDLIIRAPVYEDLDTCTHAFQQLVPYTGSPIVLAPHTPLFSEAGKDEERIFVTPAPSLKEARQHGIAGKVHLLFSLDETGGRDILSPALCLPFGDREAALRAGALAMVLGSPLKTIIHAVHTTYRNSKCSKTDPALAHMSEAAQEVAETLKQSAIAHSVQLRYEVVVEADNIVDYGIEAAIRRDCGIIIAACGETLIGGNAEQWVLRSPLPVLVAA